MIRPDVLGKLLVVQETLDVLPDVKGISAFLRRAFSEVPGVTDTHLCVGGEIIPPSDELKDICAEIEKAQSASKSISNYLDNAHYFCAPISTPRNSYGALILSLGNEKVFRPYEAFLRNIAGVVAITLENRDFIRELNDANANLEARVAERTASLAESEQRLNLALSSANMGAWDWDIVADTVVRTQRYDQIFGYDTFKEEWGLDVFLRHILPDDLSYVQGRIADSMVTGELSYECRILWPDNSVHWISIHGRLYRNEAGEPSRMLGTIMDITDAKAAEEALYRSAEEKKIFYRETLRSVSNGKLEICEPEDTRKYELDADIAQLLTSPSELSYVRRLLESYFISHGMQNEECGLFVAGVGEAMDNALKHAHCGHVFCGASDSEIWVGVRDEGPGIPALALPKATLYRGYSTKRSMGMGYTIILDASDRVMLSTGSEGTIVVLFKNLQEPYSENLLVDLVDTWDVV